MLILKTAKLAEIVLSVSLLTWGCKRNLAPLQSKFER